MRPEVLAVLCTVIATQCSGSKAVKKAVDSKPTTQGQAVLAIEERFQDIHRPASDEAQYRYVRLSNGLRVLLRSMDSAKQATVSITVHTGYGSDPAHRPGLANLVGLEIFERSSRYPKTGEFSQITQQPGYGFSTRRMRDFTQYFLQTPHAELPNVLDRMASHLATPLFSDTVSRKTIKQLTGPKEMLDTAQSIAVINAHLSRQDSPASRIGAGSAITMRAPGLPQDILSFFETHYVADNMSATITAAMPLDELQQLALNAFVSLRTGRGVKRVSDGRHLPRLTPEQQNTFVTLQMPEGRDSGFTITWQLEAADLNMNARPLAFIAYLFNTSDLQRFTESQRLCTQFTASAEVETGHAFREFAIAVKFPAGAEEDVTEVLTDILTSIVAYAQFLVESLRSAMQNPEGSEMDEWRMRWNDMRSITILSLSADLFLSNYVVNDEMDRFAPADLLVGPSVPAQFCPESVLAALETIANPQLGRGILATPMPLETVTGTDPLFQIQYHVSAKSLDDHVNDGQWLVPNMRLSPRNAFIQYVPSLPIVSSNAERAKPNTRTTVNAPTRVSANDSRNVLWYTLNPGHTAELRMLLHVAQAPQTSDDVMALHYFTILVREALYDVARDAAVVLANVSLRAVATGIEIQLNGLDSFMQPVAEAVISVIADVVMGRVDEESRTRAIALLEEHALMLGAVNPAGLQRTRLTGGRRGLALVGELEPLSAMYRQTAGVKARCKALLDIAEPLNVFETENAASGRLTGDRSDRGTVPSEVEPEADDVPVLASVTRREVERASRRDSAALVQSKLFKLHLRDYNALDDRIPGIDSTKQQSPLQQFANNATSMEVDELIVTYAMPTTNSPQSDTSDIDSDTTDTTDVDGSRKISYISSAIPVTGASDQPKDKAINKVNAAQSLSNSAAKRSKRKAKAQTAEDPLTILLRGQRKLLANTNVIMLYEGPRSSADALRMHRTIVGRVRSTLYSTSHDEGPQSLVHPIALPSGLPIILFEEGLFAGPNTAYMLVPFAELYDPKDAPQVTATALIVRAHLYNRFVTDMQKRFAECAALHLDLVHVGGVATLLFALRSSASPLEMNNAMRNFLKEQRSSLHLIDPRRFASLLAVTKEIVAQQPTASKLANIHWEAILARTNDFDLRAAVLSALNSTRREAFVARASRALWGPEARCLCVHLWNNSATAHGLAELYTSSETPHEPGIVLTSVRSVVAGEAGRASGGKTLQPAYAYADWEYAVMQLIHAP